MGAPDERAVEAVAWAISRTRRTGSFGAQARAAIAAYEQVRPDPHRAAAHRAIEADDDEALPEPQSVKDYKKMVADAEVGKRAVRAFLGEDTHMHSANEAALERKLLKVIAAVEAARPPQVVNHEAGIEEATRIVFGTPTQSSERQLTGEAIAAYIARASGSPPVTPGRQPPEGSEG